MGNRLHNGDEMGFDPIEAVGDGIDAVGDVATSAWDGAGDVVKAIPGGSWALGAVKTATGPIGDFVKGPMADFARTGVGETIFRAFSVVVGMYAAVVPAIGLLLAFLTWSIPGLARGESFMEALVKEFAYRVEYVVTFFAGKSAGEGVKEGINKMLGNQLERAIDYLDDAAKKAGLDVPTLMQKTGLTASGLAKALGIREDMASYAVEWFRGASDDVFRLINEAYGPDGTMKPEVKKAMDKIMASNPAPGSPCDTLAKLRAQGINENTSILPMRAVFMQAKALCEESNLQRAIAISTQGVGGGTTGQLHLRKLPGTSSGGTTGGATKTPCEALEAAKKANQKQPIIDALTAKCNEYLKNQPVTQPTTTLAAGAAIAANPVAMDPVVTETNDAESTKKGLAAGGIAGVLGTGGAMIAGLAALPAVAIGGAFAVGAGLTTKFLSRRKSAVG